MPLSGSSGIQRFFGIDAVPGFRGRASDSVRPYLPELTGLRGVAIMIVVLGHLLQRIERFGGGEGALDGFERAVFTIFATPFSGCCLFFSISGYLLFTYLHAATRPIGRDRLAEYSGRRILRLCPPYFFVLIATFLLLATTGYQPVGVNQFDTRPESLTASLMASLVFAHTPVFGTFPRLFPPGWFVETQVQFYVVGPVVWLLYLQIRAGTVRLTVGFLLLLAFCAASLLMAAGDSRALSYSVFALMPYFWTGALFADFRLHARGSPAGRALGGPRRAGWWGLAVFVLLGAPVLPPAVQLGARIVCLAIILHASFLGGAGLQRAMTTRWLARVGVASYSIFLVHLQILQIVTPGVMRVFAQAPLPLAAAACGVCGMAAVMAVSAAFYWLFERPWVVAARATFAPAPDADGLGLTS